MTQLEEKSIKGLLYPEEFSDLKFSDDKCSTAFYSKVIDIFVVITQNHPEKMGELILSEAANLLPASFLIPSDLIVSTLISIASTESGKSLLVNTIQEKYSYKLEEALSQKFPATNIKEISCTTIIGLTNVIEAYINNIFFIHTDSEQEYHCDNLGENNICFSY